MPAARRFDSPAAREAAAMLCGTVTAACTFDVDDLADVLVDRVDGLSALDVALGATVVIGKLIADVESVYGVPAGRSLSRLGLWVATDELADPGD